MTYRMFNPNTNTEQYLDEKLENIINPYLPKLINNDKKPFITLTYAQSIDSKISSGYGKQTVISSFDTKLMTHYLRLKHDAILIGSNTAIFDNPSLNCKIITDSNSDIVNISPRPIIIDPNGRFTKNFKNSKLYDLVLKKQGKKPIIFIKDDTVTDSNDSIIFEKLITNSNNQFEYSDIFNILYNKYNIKSIMIEGGARIINDLLNVKNNSILDSLIITIGPTFLGKDGIEVNPSNSLNLNNINWWSCNNDSVLCAHINNTT